MNVKQHVMIKTTTETITPTLTSITPGMDFISTPLTVDAGSTPPTVDAGSTPPTVDAVSIIPKASISRQYFR